MKLVNIETLLTSIPDMDSGISIEDWLKAAPEVSREEVEEWLKERGEE